MSAGVLLGLGILGGLGAIARFLLDGAVGVRLGRAFPYGTLAVNLSGAFALGVLVGAELGDDAYALAGIGFVGAYTTFSTWMLETHRLAEDGRARAAVTNVAASRALGLIAAWLGREIGGLL
jgi:fluoride exporter